MKLNFSVSDIQADEGRRLISGKILPFDNEIGQTNVGKVKFRKGSVKWDDAKKIKFLLEHDGRKPLGRAQSIMAEDDALYATFKVSATTRGNDALIEASEQLRSGLSVGVEVIDSVRVGNVLEVIEARLEEVSLVSAAAFKSAEVLEVAASEVDVVEDNNNESEASQVENTTPKGAPRSPPSLFYYHKITILFCYSICFSSVTFITLSGRAFNRLIDTVAFSLWSFHPNTKADRFANDERTCSLVFSSRMSLMSYLSTLSSVETASVAKRFRITFDSSSIGIVSLLTLPPPYCLF